MTALLAETLTRTSTGEGVQFWVLGVVAVLGALGVVCATKAVYSALFLAVTMIVLAVFYMAQGALFLGVVQVVVYTGAVMMLFLFVLMLIGVDSAESLRETIRGQRLSAIAAAVGIPVMVYNNPATAGVDLAPEQLWEALTTAERLVRLAHPEVTRCQVEPRLVQELGRRRRVQAG